MKFSAKDDYLFRAGEIATEFFIIKTGRVGVISEDGLSLMAVLEEGAFFGEIALLITKKRTMSIKCLSATEFVSISKERFLSLFENYPKKKKYLLKVANQRLKTTNKHDIPMKEV